MKLDISLIPTDAVPHVAGSLIRFLAQAAQWTRGRSTIEDIVALMQSGQYNLWVVYDTKTKQAHGFFATEIRRYPQRVMLVVQHCVIDEDCMHEIEGKMQDYAAMFARDNGCEGIEFVGRSGWKKHAERYGYGVRSVMYQKFFDRGVTQ